jgi:hypothetical protein
MYFDKIFLGNKPACCWRKFYRVQSPWRLQVLCNIFCYTPGVRLLKHDFDIEYAIAGMLSLSCNDVQVISAPCSLVMYITAGTHRNFFRYLFSSPCAP